MATGKLITSIGMTEPNCGSDLFIVAVKTNVGTDNEGVSLLLMESAYDSFEKGVPFKKIGMKSQDTCELFFDNVKVPKTNLLGEEGLGFKIMMTELARERLTVGLNAIGGAEGAIEKTIAYTSTRTAFNQPIAGFQNTQFKLAECATQLQIHQAFLDRCTQFLLFLKKRKINYFKLTFREEKRKNKTENKKH
jgi:acyl-CoA dehydrogenase